MAMRDRTRRGVIVAATATAAILTGVVTPLRAVESNVTKRVVARLPATKRNVVKPAVRLSDDKPMLPADDTAKVHGALRKKINDFQDTWRNVWKRGQFDAHSNLDPQAADSNTDSRAGAARRYWSMRCYLRTPLIFPYNTAETTVPRYPVRTTPDFGATCPLWSPPGEGIPPDEGESIDLALPQKHRRTLYLKRDTLIQVLAAAHKKYPADEWIAGQYVRFTIDQRNHIKSLAAASSCTGNPSWCAGLLGLVHEQSGNTAAADSVFHIADSLRARDRANSMECIDAETIMLFTEHYRNQLSKLPCEGQREFVRRMWWLADPLWSTPGNERYVAHGARRIHTTLRGVTERDERYIWARNGGGEALRETFTRYGWPSYTFWPGGIVDNVFAKEADTLAGSIRYAYMPFTAKEYTPDRIALMPPYKDILDPFSLNSSHWILYHPEDERGESYAPDEWWPQEHMYMPLRMDVIDRWQDAVWRRDTVVDYQLAADDPLKRVDTSATGASLAVLHAGASPTTTHEIARSAVAEGLTLRVSASFKSTPVVLSAEVLPRTLREQAFRLRYGFRPPPALRDMKATEVALSDPVFLRMPNRSMALPTDEANVRRYMAGSLSFPRDEPLALYWESYGFPPADSVQITMTVRRNDNVNLARRIFALLGIVSALRDSTTVRYSEPDTRHGTAIPSAYRPVVGRAIALDLKAQPPGEYMVSVEMRTGKGVMARSEKAFVIRRL